MQDEYERTYQVAAEQTVELGNKLAEADPDADLWDVADGLLAGAIQYWLYAHQPCGDPGCRDCADMATAESRMENLRQFIEQVASESEYYHSPHDVNAGRA